MANNRGKQFEQIFKQDWLKTFPKSFIFRIPDQVTGFKTTSQNPADYLTFTHGKLFLVECKSHDGASIPFTAIPQYERLLRYKGIDDVFPGVLVWYKDKDCIYWYGITELEKIYNAGYKSLNPEKLIKDGYDIIEIPSIKKRVFLESDYSILITLKNGE